MQQPIPDDRTQGVAVPSGQLVGICVIDYDMLDREGRPTVRPSSEHGAGIWRSGHWHVSVETAEQLIGKSIWIHEKQRGPSHFGGTITGYFMESYPGSHFDSYAVFLFVPDINHKGVKTSSEGWGQEKKYVYAK
ncbi:MULTISPECIES: hypothetical protein [unclassified Variovorax]|uniref:hypothetical protein n=1 Tax=unclassified Variovorax TaxID=663243 RepID=UPI001160C62C|nr:MULTISPECIES: hypothetical protein [unclassified Variovorax]